jgi:hypothetical protein
MMDGRITWGGGVSLTCRYLRYLKGVGTLARENDTYLSWYLPCLRSRPFDSDAIRGQSLRAEGY